MIHLDKNGRVVSTGFDGDSLPSYADEITHGLGETPAQAQRVRATMAKARAVKAKAVIDEKVKQAIKANAVKTVKDMIAARKAKRKTVLAIKQAAARDAVKVRASKQPTLGYDFSGLMGDPLAGFDQSETVLASVGLLGEAADLNIIESDDFGNTTLGAGKAAPKKPAPKVALKPAMNDFAARQREAIAAQAKKEQEELAKWAKLGKEAGVNDPKMAKMLGEKKLKEMIDKKKAKQNWADNAKIRITKKARAKLPAGNLTTAQDALYNVFFIKEAIQETMQFHDTSANFKWLVREIDGWFKYLDRNIDKLKGKNKKDAENNRNFVRNEFEKAKVKAIERTIAWRKKNGKCGFLGLDCVYPPSPLLIIGAVALVVGTLATAGALGPAAAAFAGKAVGAATAVGAKVTGATTAVTTTTGAVAAKGLSAVGLSSLAPAGTLVGKAAAGAVIKAGADKIIPKEVKLATEVATGASNLASSTTSPSAGGGVSFDPSKAAQSGMQFAAAETEKRAEKAINDTKKNVETMVAQDIAKKTGVPAASVQASLQGRTPPTPVIPAVAELAKKEKEIAEKVALSTLQEKTGIKTGVENPLWTVKEVAAEVSPQALKQGGFADVNVQAKLANAAEGLGVQISDKPDLSLSKEQRQAIAKDVAKAEYSKMTDAFNRLQEVGKKLELAKKSNLPASDVKNLELQYAQSVAEYEKAKLEGGVKVAAAAQGRFSGDFAHPFVAAGLI